MAGRQSVDEPSMSAPLGGGTESWVEGAGGGHPFGIDSLAWGAATLPGGHEPRLVARIGDLALDLAPATESLAPDLAPLVGGSSLNRLLAEPAQTWHEVRARIADWLSERRHRAAVEPHLVPVGDLRLHLPIEVADYVDFYASEHHATNAGRLFRPGGDPLPAAWKHLPIGYHGRAGTVVVSGTPVRRPRGLRRGSDGEITYGASERLDVEVEVGFVLGSPTVAGEPVPLEQAEDHLFGVCLVNDWSARDIQAFEYVPLGPFLGKSFATSVSPWVVPFEALARARVAPPPRDVPLAAYLDDSRSAPGALDLELSLRLQGTELSRPPFAAMYWTPLQLVTHLTASGATIRAGDLIASGTVSGPQPDQLGCLLELTRGGSEPLELPDGSRRGYLEDGDTVVISGRVPGRDGRPELSLGEVSGTVLAAG